MKYLRWVVATLLAVAGFALLVRLGFWQLDRLDQRRDFNRRVQAQQEAPALILAGDALSLDLAAMEYRLVEVAGVFDFSEEVALRNQSYLGRPGYRLLTPLVIEESNRAVLVDRGFVPASDYEPGEWRQFAEEEAAQVQGVIRASQAEPDFGGRVDPTPLAGEELRVWSLVDTDRIAAQTPYDLLPVFIQQSPPEGQPDLVEFPDSYPLRTRPALELDEGPHLGYALQWFTFAAILAFGFPILMLRDLRRVKLENGSG
jgi:surfeit locus 1 family protein